MHWLSKRNLSMRTFFAGRTRSAGHLNSMKLIVNGKVDVAVIDRSVLRAAQLKHPELVAKMRVLGPLDPMPVQPWVIATRLPPEVKQRLARALFSFGSIPCQKAIKVTGVSDSGRIKADSEMELSILRALATRKFVHVEDEHYNVVRSIVRNCSSEVQRSTGQCSSSSFRAPCSSNSATLSPLYQAVSSPSSSASSSLPAPLSSSSKSMSTALLLPQLSQSSSSSSSSSSLLLSAQSSPESSSPPSSQSLSSSARSDSSDSLLHLLETDSLTVWRREHFLSLECTTVHYLSRCGTVERGSQVSFVQHLQDQIRDGHVRPQKRRKFDQTEQVANHSDQ
eukprot:gb/GEZN01005668.1/.p1 GENE.gb/GEZN01005668.1/~~gb/GEZN01005668.1/.p1  ORF type:complete len:337 (-),score=40.70 gb/GEZN01005668.1/:320-1330(-)